MTWFHTSNLVSGNKSGERGSKRMGLSRGTRDHWGFRTTPQVVLVVLCTILAVIPHALSANPGRPGDPKSATRCIALELYTRSRDASLSGTTDTIRRLVGDLRGVRLKVYDLDEQPQSTERLGKIVKAYKLTSTELPFVYGLNRTDSGIADAASWANRLRKLVHVEVFTREGCSRCDGAKRYLPAFRARYPGLQVDVPDIVADAAANQRFIQLAREQGIGGISVPGFSLCRKLLVGFDNEAATAARLDAVLEKWTFACEVPPAKAAPPEPSVKVSGLPGRFGPLLAAVAMSGQPDSNPPATTPEDKDPPALPIDGPLPIDGTDDVPPLGITSEQDSDTDLLPIDASSDRPHSEEHAVEVPLLGKLSVEKLGMPLFTFLIGLVDGFNPCAMWVLLFLLSVLVNLHDRWKILAVAGTFVVVSGAAYFAFMAAWLNVLLLVGFLRWVQILLAVLALVVGSIHVKDFFAFKQGVSLSIPESAKPGIYSRVRGIVMAEHLYAAIAGATVLAVLVNIIELLCTAGLPALYSQILTLQQYPAWINYAYLLLYISAYMLDDTLMVAVVVVTLGKRKLQERQGRWLKLISGLVILALGLVLLLKPEWLG